MIRRAVAAAVVVVAHVICVQPGPAGAVGPCGTQPLPAEEVRGADTPDKTVNDDAGESGSVTDARWNWIDGTGGIHDQGLSACGGIASTELHGAPSWPGWDIARGLALYLDSAGTPRGWVLDGWGALHPVNGAPPVTANYWPGWDIARDVAVTADGSWGVTVDGYGGLHAFGTPTIDRNVLVRDAAYWPGWDIARAVVLEPDGTGGWVFDAWGGIHPFGNARTLYTSNFAVGVPEQYLPGRDWVRTASIQHDSSGEYVKVAGWHDGRYAQVNWIFPAE